MPTWEETQEYLRSRYHLVRAEPDWLGLEWSYDRSGEPAMLRIKIERISVFEEAWLLLRCAICDEGDVDARSGLRYNALLAIGSLALENGRCYLRAALPLLGMTWAHLDRSLSFFFTEATNLRQRGDHSFRTSSSVFREWAD